MRVISQIMIVFISQRTRNRVFHRNSIPVKFALFEECKSFHAGSYLRLMYQCLSRDTADIDTRTSVHFIRTFYNSHFLSTFRELCRKGLPTFAETDNNNIKCIHIHISLVS